MKNLFKLALLGAMTFSLTASAATMKELEQRIEDLEFKGYEDIFKFSGQVELRYDLIKAEDNDKDQNRTSHAVRLWSFLDMESSPSKKLSFYGRLAMAKHLNNMSNTEAGGIDTLAEGQDANYGNSDVFFQRAFVNYQFTNNLAFTFGRLPTANGTPYHLTRNESVGGAYPLLAYNAFLDGAALSYGMGNWNFKVVYTPFTFRADSAKSAADHDAFEDTDTGLYASVGYEKEKNLSWARRFAVQFSYFTGDVPIRANDLHVDNGAASTSPIALDQLSDARFIVQRAVLNIEVNQLLNTKFDFNLQLMTNNVGTGGSVDVFLNDTATTKVSSSYFLSDDGSKVSGNAGILTVRYAINDNNKVGIQYSQGSKNSFASDIVGKESVEAVVPGTAYHLFYNHTFNGGLRMNVGYQANQIDYFAPESAGKRKEVDITNSSIYTAFVADF